MAELITIDDDYLTRITPLDCMHEFCCPLVAI